MTEGAVNADNSQEAEKLLTKRGREELSMLRTGTTAERSFV
jgi:hypothetical protein